MPRLLSIYSELPSESSFKPPISMVWYSFDMYFVRYATLYGGPPRVKRFSILRIFVIVALKSWQKYVFCGEKDCFLLSLSHGVS